MFRCFVLFLLLQIILSCPHAIYFMPQDLSAYISEPSELVKEAVRKIEVKKRFSPLPLRLELTIWHSFSITILLPRTAGLMD